jgi:hypothetical protein
MSFAFKTRSEQQLEYLQGLKRPLTDQESDDLRRSMHAVYCRQRVLKQHRAEELKLVKRLESEARTPERYCT